MKLFDGLAETRREKLAASAYGGLRPGEKVVDLFCGAGGWGEGAKALGIQVDFAVNHWPVAIDTHRANNPGCQHHLGDAWRARPRDVVGAAKIGLLLASAACTTHSRARGSAPVSKRVHMLGWCIARWMKEVGPRLVLIENVPEWRDWGPLIPKRDSRGRPVKDEKGRAVMIQDPARKGKHYRALLRYMRRLGYTVDEIVLDAPDFGEASRRKRLFVQARSDGQPIVWPERTHGKVESDGARRCHQGAGQCGIRDRSDRRRRVFDPDAGPTCRRAAIPALDGTEVHSAWPGGGSEGSRLHPYRSAAECIDWSDLGRSIFDRKQPLKPKTQARIAEGIRRYVIKDPAPFVLRVTQAGGKGWHVAPVDQPLPTQTTRQDLAFATPVMATTRNGERPGQAPRCHPVTDPLMTVTGGGAQGIATPILAGAGGSAYAGKPTRADAPVGTVKCEDRRGIATPVLMNNTTGHTGGRVDDPAPTVTTGGQTGLVTPVVAALRNNMDASPVDAPIGTISAGGIHAGLIAPMLSEYHGSGSGETLRPADQPMGAVTTVQGHAAVNAVLSSWELAIERGRRVARWLVEHLGDEVPIDEETGLAYTVIDGVRRFFVDVLFRMLRPLELARAMGFPDSYAWPRTRNGRIHQRDTVRLIGNAVSVRTARALLAACLPRGVIRRRRSA